MFWKNLVSVILALWVCSVQAESIAVSIHGDLMGEGVEVTKPLSSEFNGRLGYHQSSYQGSDYLTMMEQLSFFWTDLFGMTKSNNVYTHDSKQKMLSFVADWYPNQESEFRWSLGLGYNEVRDKFVALEQVTGGYNIGGSHYTAGQVGTLTGSKQNKGVVPYFGFGWGNPLKKENGWGFTFDFGMSYLGKSSVTLNATGNPLAKDLEVERQRLEKEALDWLAILSLGLSYSW